MDLLTGDKLITLLEEVKTTHKTNPHLRWGQILFNSVYEKYPELAQPLRASNVDCFYNNKNINPFLKHISVPEIHDAIDMDFY